MLALRAVGGYRPMSMESLSLHDFVAAAYALAGVMIGVFVIATLWRRYKARRMLARLEGERT